jgi:hypothetical protein
MFNAALKAIQHKQAAEQNRIDFPHASKMVDQLKALFGDDILVLYIEENEKTIGSKTARESGRFLTVDRYLALGQRDKNIESLKNAKK